MSLIMPPRNSIPVEGLPVRQHIPDGALGARWTMSGMANMVNGHPCKDLLKGITDKLCASATTDQQRIDMIFRWASAIIQYEKDPPNEELVKSPCRILREAADKGRATGDCDDSAVLIAACLKVAGIPCQFMAVSNEKLSLVRRDPPLDHVFTVAFDRDRQRWVAADPVAPGVSWVGHKYMTHGV